MFNLSLLAMVERQSGSYRVLSTVKISFKNRNRITVSNTSMAVLDSCHAQKTHEKGAPKICIRFPIIGLSHKMEVL
jgi:hypothetical protein